MSRRMDVALAAAFLLAGCREPFSADATESHDLSDITPDEGGQVERAGLEWNEVTFPSKHIACDIPICWVGLKHVHLYKQQPENGFEAWTDQINVIMWTPGVIGDRLHDDVKHEFGHVLGLDHTTTGVMTPHTDDGDITPEVLAECRRVGACP